MSVIDELLQNNRRIAAERQARDAPVVPARGVAVVACMDARMLVTEMLGISRGDAHIIRNAGACVTEDTLRSLLLSTWRMHTREIAVIGHTDCGLHGLPESEFVSELQRERGTSAHPGPFYAFHDLDAHVAAQVAKARGYPLLPAEVTVRGFVYDVKTRLLREVAPAG